MQRFERIYAEHHDAVRAYVRRRVAEDAVDDVVSETFLVCWRKLDGVPEEALPWLYAVARKTLANHRRKLARQLRCERRPRASRIRSGTERSPPSPDRQVLAFPPVQGLQGVAADGVATVELTDDNGNVVASAPVTNNLFESDAAPSGTPAFIVTLDASGNVTSKRSLP